MHMALLEASALHLHMALHTGPTAGAGGAVHMALLEASALHLGLQVHVQLMLRPQALQLHLIVLSLQPELLQLFLQAHMRLLRLLRLHSEE